MISLEKFTQIKAEELDSLFLEIAKQDENISQIYEEKIKGILEKLKMGQIKPPTDLLNGYLYYFLPEGPWNVWGRFPALVNAFSNMANLLIMKDEEEFKSYLKRTGIANDLV